MVLIQLQVEITILVPQLVNVTDVLLIVTVAPPLHVAHVKMDISYKLPMVLV